MTIHILILCFVQGISEFLPISSSAHLLLLSKLFNLPPTSLEWEVALHFGTLLAVITYFWQDLWLMTCRTIKGAFGLKAPASDPYYQKAWYLVLATIPAVVIGYMVKKIDGVSYSPHLIGWASIIFGLLLYGVDRLSKTTGEISALKAFGIGCMQVIAFIPGVSRSGSCITAARAFGLDRIQATRFAFLLSIPTVVGAVTLTAYDAVKENIPLDFLALGPAVLLTAIIGLCVIHGILKFLNSHSFSVFTVYRVALGAALLYFL